MKLHDTLVRVTERIRQRSATQRAAYLQRVAQAANRPPGVERMGCANVAHALAAMQAGNEAAALPSGRRSIPYLI